jgi:hypothetical protein
LKQRDLLLKLELQSNPELLCAVRGAMERLTEKIGFLELECRLATRMKQQILNRIAVWQCGPATDDASLVLPDLS